MTLHDLPRTGKWPDVEFVPRARLRAAIARRLLRRIAARLPLRIELPDGTALSAAQGVPVLRLHRPEAFYHRVGTGGLIGFGEAYQAGDWDSDDLPGLLTVMASDLRNLVPRAFHWMRRAYVTTTPSGHDNSPSHSANNVSHHYDLSNELFALFLDETMTYSSAWFDGHRPGWDGFADAQRRKIDRLLDATGVTAGSRVLEIGTGWGELAIRAAKRGAIVDTITLSREQYEHAQAHARNNNVSNTVTVRLCDYRQLRGHNQYDAIVSVEMIEAVGEHYWPEYFRTLDRLLKPGGRVGIQAITMDHKRMKATRNTRTWIHKYIFPGGLIPSVEAIAGQVAANSRLRIVDRFAFGGDYAHTLRLWRERFTARSDELARLGFDEVFGRTWQLYLSYSQAGFASGYLDVHQFIAEAGQ